MSYKDIYESWINNPALSQEGKKELSEISNDEEENDDSSK